MGDKGRGRKRRKPEDIGRLAGRKAASGVGRKHAEQPAVPAVIRLTDGGFAERLAGKYVWRTAGRLARGEMVHRMREQARTPEAVSVHVQLLLRQIRLMVPLHLRIEGRAAALPLERRDAAARGGSVARAVSPAPEPAQRLGPAPDGNAGRSRAAQRETAAGMARPSGKRHRERRVERAAEREPIRPLAGRRGERTGEPPVAGSAAVLDARAETPFGPVPHPFDRLAPEPSVSRAFRLLAAAVRTPIFGRTDADFRPGTRPAPPVPELRHRLPVRPDVSALQAPGALSARGPRADAAARTEREPAFRGRVLSPESDPRREERSILAPRRIFTEPDAPAARRPVPASPAVTVPAAPPVLTAFRAAFPLPPDFMLSPGIVVRLAERVGARTSPTRVSGRSAPETPDAAEGTEAGRVVRSAESSGHAALSIAAKYRHRARPADGRTVIVHRAEGARGGREKAFPDAASGSLARLGRLLRERAAERITLVRTAPDRMQQRGSAGRPPSADASGRTARTRTAEVAAGPAVTEAGAVVRAGRARPAARTGSGDGARFIRAAADRGPLAALPAVPGTAAHVPVILAFAARRAAAEAAGAAPFRSADAPRVSIVVARPRPAGSDGRTGNAPVPAARTAAPRTESPRPAASARTASPPSAAVPPVPSGVTRSGTTRSGTALSLSAAALSAAAQLAANVAHAAGRVQPAHLTAPGTSFIAPVAAAVRNVAASVLASAGPGMLHARFHRERTDAVPVTRTPSAAPSPDAAMPAQSVTARSASAPSAVRPAGTFPNLAVLQPPAPPVPDMDALFPAARTRRSGEPGYVRVERVTPPADREIARPAGPRVRMVHARPPQAHPPGTPSGSAGAASSSPGGAAASVSTGRGRGDGPMPAAAPGITTAVRLPARRRPGNFTLTLRRPQTASSSTPSMRGSARLTPAAAAFPGVLRARPAQPVGAPGPADLYFASAGRQSAGAEAPPGGFDGGARRQVREVPLQFAVRPSPRLNDSSPVIRELRNALRGVEKELSRMKEEKPAEPFNSRQLADELYREVSRRIRLDQFRRGF